MTSQLTDIATSWIDTSTGAVAALRAGPADGDPVLLLPGYTGSKEDFAPLLAPLAQAGFAVTAIDLPGQYESSGPADPAAPTETYAQAGDGVLNVVPGESGVLGTGGPVTTFDVEVEELHTLVADDIVVHNCAPPFRQAEFDIIYNVGISREGSLIDMGVENGIVRKSGAWYTYEGDQLGQGKENSRNFLRDNPDLANEIEKKIKEKLGIGARIDDPIDLTVAPVPIDV